MTTDCPAFLNFIPTQHHDRVRPLVAELYTKTDRSQEGIIDYLQHRIIAARDHAARNGLGPATSDAYEAALHAVKVGPEGLRSLLSLWSQWEDERDWPASLAAEAFHGITGEVVRAIEPHTEADPAAVLTNFLVLAGNAIGPNPHARVGATRHALNLYKADIGKSSKGRKGTGLSYVQELLRLVDQPWHDERIDKGLSSGEGLIAPVRDPSFREKDGELIVVDEGVADKRLMVIESEMANMLKVMAREGNTLSPVIRQAWDGGILRTMTKNSRMRATGTHISLIGHITREELLRHLNDTECANGFGNRFLWICVKRSKLLPEGGGDPFDGALVSRLLGILQAARNLHEIRRDDGARYVWQRLYADLSQERSGLLGAITGRAEAQVLRLSALYAALDGEEVIRIPHLLAALAVWEYADASARFIFGNATGDDYADMALEALQRAPGGLTRTEIRDHFGRHAPAGRIHQALKLLLRLGRVHVQQRQTGGRPAEVWLAHDVPAVAAPRSAAGVGGSGGDTAGPLLQAARRAAREYAARGGCDKSDESDQSLGERARWGGEHDARRHGL